jgi:hypothetical protein|tara:strand:+ start:2694 stop:3275 length:582 start_codon:yes stop_codon:yes gene_type:complete
MTLMEHYPSAIMDFPINEVHEDGSITVHCSIVIGKLARHMWLPVMNNKNQAIIRPNARDISDAKMRCLVKCMALFGLGMYVYAGEDLPQKEQPVAEVKPEPAAKKTKPKKKEPVSDEPVEDYSEKESASLFRELWTGWIKVEETEDSMKSLYRSNQGTITTIQNHQPEIFEEIKKAFNDRKREIANQNQEGEG